MPTLRYMHVQDVPEVMKIEAAAFPDSWSARSYYFEINESRVSHMVVLETPAPPHSPSSGEARGWRAWWRRWRSAPATEVPRHMLGYGGLWHIAEEAHISTIASAPQERRKGYGEALLLGMLMKSLHLGAEYVVLEVRVSNHGAQALYHKHGFQIVDVKPNYYHSNQEDAYDMRLNLLDEQVRARLPLIYEEACTRLGLQDLYSSTPHPRLS